jgi:sulfoxide reductase heme-binding subunit YedZ
MGGPWRDRAGAFAPLKAACFALLFVPALWMARDYAVGAYGPIPTIGLIYESGLWATALLLLALAVSPLRAAWRWNGVIALRRMMGVAALAYTLAHLVIYFWLDLWNFTLVAREMTTRLTLMLATLSLIGLIALGATSTDAAQRRLGARGWKRLHRLNAVLTLLAVVHFVLSPGIYQAQYLAAGVLFWLLAWRALAPRVDATQPAVLVGLAVAAAAFTAALEIAWLRAYHRIAPAQTLDDLFGLEAGLDPAWQVLALGLVVAMVAWHRARTSLRPVLP